MKSGDIERVFYLVDCMPENIFHHVATNERLFTSIWLNNRLVQGRTGSLTFRSSSASVGRSEAKASEAKVSIIRFTHNI